MSHPGIEFPARGRPSAARTGTSRRRGGAALLGVALACALTAAPAHALKLVTWNVMRYNTGALDFQTRQANFRTVMAALNTNVNPDLIVLQEFNSLAAADSFRINVLDVVAPGQWVGGEELNGWQDVNNGEGMGVFWKPNRVSLTEFSTIFTGGPRGVFQFRVYPAGYSETVSFKVASMHLNAGVSDSTSRRLECTTLRDYLNFTIPGDPFLLVGDSNFYGSSEGGYIRLVESQADNDGRCKDPITIPGSNWHGSSSAAPYDTQSPCLSGCLNSDFATGGMDDRFDLVLTSYDMQDGEGIDYVPGSTVAYGNDNGAHFHKDINSGGINNQVGITVANALRSASDHIPVIATLQMPARVVAASQINFGRVYLDRTPVRSLTVADGAAVPADELNYTLTAPAGFTAPAGGFTANAGVAGNVHSIGLDASATGTFAGTLDVASNDPDSALKTVSLSGTVIRHASPSLDSLESITRTTVNFGALAPGTFTDVDVRVHNRGYDASQSLLSLDTATLTGGGGRFTLVDGFNPVALGGVGHTYAIHFDDAGGAPDSTYNATLVFAGTEEAAEGQVTPSALTLTLLARPVSGLVGVTPGPAALRFEPARPNPLSRATTFAFSLPRAQAATLELYDLGGRRIASLASGEQGAGRHEVSWGARDAQGARVPGGLYFARFATAGLVRVERVIVLP